MGVVPINLIFIHFSHWTSTWDTTKWSNSLIDQHEGMDGVEAKKYGHVLHTLDARV